MTTGTNQFVPFATGTGANVYSAAAFAGLPARATGVMNGIADGQTFNSAWRQGTSMSAMLGQFISANGYDALDDGDIATLKAHFEAALGVMIAAGLPTIPSTSYIHVGAGGGTANAQTATVVPAITAYEDGHIFEITPAATTTSTSPTINICSLGAKTIVRPDGSPLIAGEIVDGAKVLLAYDADLSKVVLLGVSKPYVDAAVAGVSISGRFVGLEVVTATGTWTRPVGVTKALVFVTGGGGAGGYDGTSGSSAWAGGGGAGATAIALVDVTSLASVACTVGAGGTGYSGYIGNAGGSSSFGGHAVAGGGSGGGIAGSGYRYGGLGGLATAGDLRIGGGGGGGGSTFAGEGGASFWGGGGAANSSFVGHSPDARAYGAGGAAGGALTAANGDGGDGVILILEFA